jgi:hypothetical protein
MLVQGEASGGGMWLKCGNGGTTQECDYLDERQ